LEGPGAPITILISHWPSLVGAAMPAAFIASTVGKTSRTPLVLMLPSSLRAADVEITVPHSLGKICRVGGLLPQPVAAPPLQMCTCWNPVQGRSSDGWICD
jgi:hypothetical protein